MSTDKKTNTIGFHSNDFERHALDILENKTPKINGKTKAEWEEEFDIVGAIVHLKNLGWSHYQWRYWTPETIAKMKEEKQVDFTCFAEFFGPYYHGYLRGDGPDVKTAVMQCLARAQKMAKCERQNGHQYLVRYGNGLIQCDKCGFNGFSSQVSTLITEVDNLKIHNKILQEENVRIYNAIKAAGFRWSIKSGFETLERIEQGQ
jgi:ribosomal protein L37AE/L43A